MKLDSSILRNDEQVVLRLREIYQKHGYSCFKMSKFEEYDLYSRNKDFLVSQGVITFTDGGRLMALKPDVTLSIVKNFKEDGGVQCLYYNENVYRISGDTHSYKEIMQTGLECLGQLDEYHLLEVVTLAAESLKSISENCVLNISHLGVISGILEDIPCRKALVGCVREKNPHGIRELCRENGVAPETEALLILLSGAHGQPEETVEKVRSAVTDPEIQKALAKLERIAAQAKALTGVPVQVDFSLVSDMRYYNGLVLEGYVENVPTCVLRGGQYDKLMARMGKNGGAVGFAVYLDLLERMTREYDVDVLLLYGSETDPGTVARRAAAIIASGKRVAVRSRIPEKLVYREIQEV